MPAKKVIDCCISILVWMALVFLCGMILISMGACRSIKYVPVEMVIRDSVAIRWVDSLKITNKTNIIDSIRIKDSIVITKDEQGNITGKEEYHDKEHYHQSTDSTAYYRDLLLNTIQEHSEQKPQIVEVEKPLSKLQKLFIDIGKVASGIGAGLVIVFLVWLVIWVKKNKLQ